MASAMLASKRSVCVTQVIVATTNEKHPPINRIHAVIEAKALNMFGMNLPPINCISQSIQENGALSNFIRIEIAPLPYLWGWRWIVFVIWGLPYGIVGLYDTAIGQGFLPSHYPKLASLIPNWIPTVWFVLGVIAIMVVTFEGSYRLAHRKSSRPTQYYSFGWGDIENYFILNANGLYKYNPKEVQENDSTTLVLSGNVYFNITRKIEVKSLEIIIEGKYHNPCTNQETSMLLQDDLWPTDFAISSEVQRGTRTARIHAIIDGNDDYTPPFTLNLPKRK